MKKLIKRFLHRFGHTAGRFPHLDFSDRLSCFLHGMRAAGFAPREVYDVGAHKGDWTRTARAVFPSASYVLFEPQGNLKAQAHRSLLSAPDVEWYTAAVSDRCGSGTFTLAKRSDSSSLSMPSDHPIAAGAIEVPLITLNQVAALRGCIPEMVKIDAEGHDLRVLEGASALLGKTDVFFVECAVCCPEFENTLVSVSGFMWEAGYRLAGLTSLLPSPATGELWLVEGAFVRQEALLAERYRRFE